MKPSRVLVIAGALFLVCLAGVTAVCIAVKSITALILSCLVPVGIVSLMVLIAAWQTQSNLARKKRNDAQNTPFDRDDATH